MRLIQSTETGIQSSVRGRVIAVRRSRDKVNIGAAWLENLILTTKVVRDAGDVAPFPYIKFAASLVVQVLEVIQLARRNKEDFEELATNLVDIIVTIRDTILSHCDNYNPPPAFTRQCEEFVEKLLKMSSQLNEVVRQTRSWTRYFRTSAIRDTVAQYRRQVDGLKSNFTLATVMNLSLQIYTERLPRQMGYTWEFSKPLNLIDAMNVTITLPVDLCSTRSDFDDLLKFIFRKRRGRQYIEHGHYNLTRANENTLIQDASWRSEIRPGTTVAMNILLQSFSAGNDTDGRRCPSCDLLCDNASLGDEVICSSCGTFFRVSRGIIEEISSDTSNSSLSKGLKKSAETTSSQASNTNGADGSSTNRSSPSQYRQTEEELFDIRYFRRFHIFLQEWDTSQDHYSHEQEDMGQPDNHDLDTSRTNEYLFPYPEWKDPIARNLHPLLSLKRLDLDLRARPNDDSWLNLLLSKLHEDELYLPATQPAAQEMRLCHPLLPWTITITQSYEGGVTIGDVLEQLAWQLTRLATREEYYAQGITSDMRQRISIQYRERTRENDIMKNRIGLERVDFLDGNVLFERIARMENGMWEVKTSQLPEDSTSEYYLSRNITRLS